MQYVRGLKYWTDEEKMAAQEEKFRQQCERERNSPNYVPPRPRVKFWKSPQGWWAEQGDYERLFFLAVGFPLAFFIVLFTAIAIAVLMK